MVLEELPRLADLRVQVVIAGVRADANLLAFLLVLLGGRLFLRLLIAKLAVVHDLTNRWTLHGRNFHEVLARLAGQFLRLIGWHNTKLLALCTDQADRTNSDLLVDSQAAVNLRADALGRRDTKISFLVGIICSAGKLAASLEWFNCSSLPGFVAFVNWVLAELPVQIAIGSR